jgi:hypothetical protein
MADLAWQLVGGWSSLVPFLLGTEQYLLSIHCGRLAMLN